MGVFVKTAGERCSKLQGRLRAQRDSTGLAEVRAAFLRFARAVRCRPALRSGTAVKVDLNRAGVMRASELSAGRSGALPVLRVHLAATGKCRARSWSTIRLAMQIVCGLFVTLLVT